MESKTRNIKYYVGCTTAWLIYTPAAFVALVIALILAGVEPITRGQTLSGLGIFIAVILGYIGLCMETVRVGKEKQAAYKEQLILGIAISVGILGGLFVTI